MRVPSHHLALQRTPAQPRSSRRIRLAWCILTNFERNRARYAAKTSGQHTRLSRMRCPQPLGSRNSPQKISRSHDSTSVFCPLITIMQSTMFLGFCGGKNILMDENRCLEVINIIEHRRISVHGPFFAVRCTQILWTAHLPRNHKNMLFVPCCAKRPCHALMGPRLP